MKSMKALWLPAAVAALTYAGFVLGIEGAQRVLMFFIWAISFPLSLLSMTDHMQKVLASTPETPKPLHVMCRLVEWVLLIALVWSGFIFTAVAQFIGMTVSAGVRSKVNDLRAKAAATAA